MLAYQCVHSNDLYDYYADDRRALTYYLLIVYYFGTGWGYIDYCYTSFAQ